MGDQCRKCGTNSWAGDHCRSCDGVSSFIIHDDHTLSGRARAGGGELMQLEFAERLATSRSFRGDFSRSLQRATARAGGASACVFWECAAFAAGEAAAAATPWECALLPAHLDDEADGAPFAARFEQAARGDSAVFRSPSGAVLVAPRRKHGAGEYEARYAHLGAFLAGGEADEVDNLWRRVGQEAQKKIAASERWWLSTEGSGVHWLHVRLENAPHYFKVERFK